MVKHMSNKTTVKFVGRVSGAIGRTYQITAEIEIDNTMDIIEQLHHEGFEHISDITIYDQSYKSKITEYLEINVSASLPELLDGCEVKRLWQDFDGQDIYTPDQKFYNDLGELRQDNIVKLDDSLKYTLGDNHES
jgi:hypothetical protein